MLKRKREAAILLQQESKQRREAMQGTTPIRMQAMPMNSLTEPTVLLPTQPAPQMVPQPAATATTGVTLPPVVPLATASKMVPPALPEVRVVMRPVVPQQRAQNVLSNGMMRAGQQLATQMAAKEQLTFARDNFKNVLLGNSATNGIVHETIKSFPKVRAHAVRRQCERAMREQCKEHVRVQRCVRDS